MLIFLIGYMGCGKSTIGRKLSTNLNWRLVDTDQLIESLAGVSIAEIFANSGEEHFRALERTVLKEIIKRGEDCIVSTGGGLPTWGDNMDIMSRSGSTIYLRRSAENIASRMSPRGREKRPKLRGLSDEELVAFMSKGIAERDPIYRRAKYVVDAVPLSDQQIVSTIVGLTGAKSTFSDIKLPKVAKKSVKR